MTVAFIIVACILFLIVAVFPPYDAPNWPQRFIPLGLFFFSLSFIWGRF